MFKRWFIFSYAIVCYVMFLLTFLYAMGFVANVYVPRTIDGEPSGSLVASVIVDLALLTLFALQHSIMARKPFKQWLTRVIPEPAERSTYVLASNLALIVLFAFWHPLGGTVWSIAAAPADMLLYGLCALGWLLVLLSTCLIDHFDLFGLRQAWLYLKGKPYEPVGFRQPGPYRVVRHPLYVGFLLAFWATPHMTVTHLLFAVATTGYILVGIHLEERDLLAQLGNAYRDYRKRVPMLVPFLARGGKAADTAMDTPDGVAQ